MVILNNNIPVASSLKNEWYIFIAFNKLHFICFCDQNEIILNYSVKYFSTINLVLFCFRFPFKRPDILQKWVLAINKKNFKPDNNHHVCSAHFKDEDFQQHLGCFRKVLKEHAVPSVFPAYQKYYQYKSNKLRNTRTSAAAQSQHPETLPSTSSCEPVMVTSDVLIFVSSDNLCTNSY